MTNSSRERKGSTLVVLAARWLLLLAAAAFAAAGFAVPSRDDSASAPARIGYVCPMHPEVTAHEPGTCPICRMALEPNGATKPAHPPPAAPAPKPAAREVIPASSSKYGPGVTWLPEAYPPAPARTPGDRPALATPKRRVYTDRVRASAWLETPERVAALLYRDELVRLAPGELGSLFRSAAPRDAIAVRAIDEPPTPWDASTSLVRFEIVDEPGVPPPSRRAGDVGWLDLPPKPRELLVFPESALLRSNDGPHVLVPAGAGFARRRLQIGRILKGQVVLLSGLGEDEPIVVGGAFFLDGSAHPAPQHEPVAGGAP